jgi:hypothetical protein
MRNTCSSAWFLSARLGKFSLAKIIAAKFPVSCRAPTLAHVHVSVTLPELREALSAAPRTGDEQMTALAYFLRRFAQKTTRP